MANPTIMVAPGALSTAAGVTTYNGVTGLSSANATPFPRSANGVYELEVSVGANASGATGSAVVGTVSLVGAAANAGNTGSGSLGTGSALYLAGGVTGVGIKASDAGKVLNLTYLDADNNGHPAWVLAQVAGATGPVPVSIVIEGETF